jgi:hypothetical protein
MSTIISKKISGARKSICAVLRGGIAQIPPSGLTFALEMGIIFVGRWPGHIVSFNLDSHAIALQSALTRALFLLKLLQVKICLNKMRLFTGVSR